MVGDTKTNFDKVVTVYKELPALGLAYDRDQSLRVMMAFTKTVNEMGRAVSSDTSSSSSDSDSTDSSSSSSPSHSGVLGGTCGTSDEEGG